MLSTAHCCAVQIVFSSSCTVYGNPQYVPIDEKHPLKAVSPYGRTKLIIEDIFRDLYAAEKDWKIILLRYFNPVGAHSSGNTPTIICVSICLRWNISLCVCCCCCCCCCCRPADGKEQQGLAVADLCPDMIAGEIGEHPVGIPNNLMPYIQQVALSQRDVLSVYGTDYNTRDGTAIRDYIHVVDLADGHTAALSHLAASTDTYCKPINLGTGVGSSVLEMVDVRLKSPQLVVSIMCCLKL